MNNLKYLSDGRKVVVVGSINQTEYIVQEIFITEDGSEIPSGEKFTAKTLHNTPVESYLDRSIKSKEETLSSRNKEIEALNKQIAQTKFQRDAEILLLKRTNFVAEALPEFDWDLFCDVLGGNIKYVVEWSKYSVRIYDFAKEGFDTWQLGYEDNPRIEGLKAISIYAKGGETSFRLGAHSDLSGNSREVLLCRDLDELKSKLQGITEEMYIDGKLTASIIKEVQPYIEISKDVSKTVVDREIKNVIQEFERVEDIRIDAYNKRINKLERMLL